MHYFKKQRQVFNGARCLANSAAILKRPYTHADWVRPGIMLYGISPFAGSAGADLELKAVMGFYSRIICVLELKKGDKIGYGSTWECPEAMRVGVVAVGYGDGYLRHANSGTPMLVDGQRCPLVGRVSMDMISVDLRAQPSAKIGSLVTLWDEHLPAEEVAGHMVYDCL